MTNRILLIDNGQLICFYMSVYLNYILHYVSFQTAKSLCLLLNVYIFSRWINYLFLLDSASSISWFLQKTEGFSNTKPGLDFDSTDLLILSRN